MTTAPAARLSAPVRRRLTALGLVALVLATAPAGADGLPERFEASFVLNAQGMDIAQAHWQLSPAGGGRYVYSSRSEAIGLAKLLRDDRIEERSEWQLSRSGEVVPLNYSYTRTGGKRERVVEVRFDWRSGRVHNTLNGHSWSMDLAPGTLDKLVYLLALMRDLSEGARETQYAVADGGKLKRYVLRVIAEERMETVLGPLDTLVVERLRDGDDDRTTVVWCAPALRFLPVRVEHRDTDGTVRMTLTHLEGITP